MRGRSSACLLAIFASAVFASAISFLILTPSPLSAQSDRDHTSPDFSIPLSPLHARPPSDPPMRGPILHPPRLPVTAPGTIGLPQIVRAAGSIFSGTVTSIASHPFGPANGQSVATVAITFHVERAIRGPIPGSDVIISQWIGAWSSGQRYRIGDRVLLFVYPPSRLGLTSSVGGAIGRFHIDPLGRVRLSAQQLAAFRADPVLGGRTLVPFQDFALAVGHAAGEERTP
jgi:hypothetical protein